MRSPLSAICVYATIMICGGGPWARRSRPQSRDGDAREIARLTPVFFDPVRTSISHVNVPGGVDRQTARLGASYQ